MNRQIGLLLSCTLGVACSTEPEPELGLGTLSVTVVANGGDLDLDGYLVAVDGSLQQTVPQGGTVDFVSLSAGIHEVQLLGVADNCEVNFSPNRLIRIAKDDTTLELFQVRCFPTGVEIRVNASGLDEGGLYVADLDGTTIPILPGMFNSFTRLAPGTHVVSLSAVPSNCRTEGTTTRSITLVLRQLARVTFTVSCVAATGVLAVDIATSGQDHDINGFVIQVDGDAPNPVASAGRLLLPGLTPGKHTVRFGGVAPNCALLEAAAVEVVVRAGGATRDTTRLSYRIQCTRLWQVAFTRVGMIGLATADFTKQTFAVTGDRAVWSRNGDHLAWECPSGVCTVNLNTGEQRTVTSGVRYTQSPAWLPDGRISVVGLDCSGFYCYGDIAGVFIKTVDGETRTRISIPAEVIGMWDLEWSPDGQWLAFTCVMANGMSDICRVSLTGTFVRLTDGGHLNQNPAWAPDGSGIVFETTRYGPATELAFLDPLGAVTRVSPGTEVREPTWLPDGSGFLFAGPSSGVFGLFRMNRDGTGVVRLTTTPDGSPALRP